MKYTVVSLVALLALSACQQEPKTYTIEEIRLICEEERRDAQGVRGDVTFGGNTQSGPFTQINININDKFIRGEDPEAVYDDCLARYIPQNQSATETQ